MKKMNLICFKMSNGFVYKLPVFKDYKSINLTFELLTKEKMTDVEDVFYINIKTNVKSEFSIINNSKFFKENIENKYILKDYLKEINFKINSLANFYILRNNIVINSFLKNNIEFSSLIESKSLVKFSTINIIKKNGKKKERYICMPNNNEVKTVYRNIKTLLTESIELEQEMLGVGKGLEKSISYFKNSNSLVKIDFKNFFNQISYKKFINALELAIPFLEKNVLKNISMIVCPYSPDEKKRATFQGLPTSTICAYIALLPLFKEIKSFLLSKNITPVIYIDDLCFEAKNKKEAEILLKQVLKIIKKHKFIFNKEKSKVLYGNKTFFLGINMKTKKLPLERMRQLRASLNNFFHENDEILKEQMRPSVIGKLNYCKMINKEQFNDLFTHPKYSIFIKDLLNIN